MVAKMCSTLIGENIRYIPNTN